MILYERKKNMKKMDTRTLLSMCCCIFGAFWPNWVWAKKCLFLQESVLKKGFNHFIK